MSKGRPEDFQSSYRGAEEHDAEAFSSDTAALRESVNDTFPGKEPIQNLIFSLNLNQVLDSDKEYRNDLTREVITAWKSAREISEAPHMDLDQLSEEMFSVLEQLDSGAPYSDKVVAPIKLFPEVLKRALEAH